MSTILKFFLPKLAFDIAWKLFASIIGIWVLNKSIHLMGMKPDPLLGISLLYIFFPFWVFFSYKTSFFYNVDWLIQLPVSKANISISNAVINITKVITIVFLLWTLQETNFLGIFGFSFESQKWDKLQNLVFSQARLSMVLLQISLCSMLCFFVFSFYTLQSTRVIRRFDRKKSIVNTKNLRDIILLVSFSIFVLTIVSAWTKIRHIFPPLFFFGLLSSFFLASSAYTNFSVLNFYSVYKKTLIVFFASFFLIFTFSITYGFILGKEDGGMYKKVDALNVLDERYFRPRTGDNLGETLVSAMPERRWQATFRVYF